MKPLMESLGILPERKRRMKKRLGGHDTSVNRSHKNGLLWRANGVEEMTTSPDHELETGHTWAGEDSGERTAWTSLMGGPVPLWCGRSSHGRWVEPSPGCRKRRWTSPVTPPEEGLWNLPGARERVQGKLQDLAAWSGDSVKCSMTAFSTRPHCCSVARSCLTLGDPIDCSPPGSSVHGVSMARILEWVAISFSRGSSWPRESLPLSHQGSLQDLIGLAI